MIWLKLCPRCHGDLVTESYSCGRYVSCLQCGGDFTRLVLKRRHPAGSATNAPDALEGLSDGPMRTDCSPESSKVVVLESSQLREPVVSVGSAGKGRGPPAFDETGRGL